MGHPDAQFFETLVAVVSSDLSLSQTSVACRRTMALSFAAMSLRHLIRYTVFGRIALIPFRLGWALMRCWRQVAAIVKWAFKSKEYYNYTYHLTDLNLAYLVSYIAV